MLIPHLVRLSAPLGNLYSRLPRGYSTSSAYHEMMSRFIKRLILDGKKGAATKIFDASLELLKKNIEQYLEDEGKTSVSGSAHKRTTLTLTEKNNLYLLANLTKEEIFVTALRKAQP